MNAGQMTGAAVAGLLVAVAGPGLALLICAVGMSGTVPLMLAVKGGRAAARAVGEHPNMFTDLREGWAEFRKHTWLWATVIQYCLVMMAWNGAFMVLGPVVARAHLGGAAGWGAISAADALGLVAGGIVALRYTPRRPMLFVVGAGGLLAITPLLLGLAAPLVIVCLASFALGALIELMMVQWTVAMATRIPSDKLARVASYDAMGSLAAMPVGALVAGPLAASIGVPATQFAAAAVIAVASAVTLIPRDIWRIRSDDVARGAAEISGGTEIRELDLGAAPADPVPADPVPAEPLPAEPLPADSLPADSLPLAVAVTGAVPAGTRPSPEGGAAAV
jgi:hypothetical protein